MHTVKTLTGLFEAPYLFLSVLGSRPHGNVFFGHRNQSFSKTLRSSNLFENSVFQFSYSLRADFTKVGLRNVAKF